MSSTALFSTPMSLRRTWRKLRGLFRRLDPGVNAGWSKRTR
ncbi:MAG: hypothetical protein ACRD12_17220 [Acidimicrobiales bacterium]